MNNIGDVFDFINFVANTYLNGYFSPEEVSSALDNGQLLLWRNYVNERQKGNELALVALQPFYKTVTTTATSNGLATYPALFAETNGIYITIDGVLTPITEVLHTELTAALNSSICPIAEFPRFLKGGTGITIYPKEARTGIEWQYLSRPTSPVMNYTVSTNQVIYNPTGSVQLEFDRQYWNEVISLSLPYLSTAIANEDMGALAELFKLNKNDGSPN